MSEQDWSQQRCGCSLFQTCARHSVAHLLNSDAAPPADPINPGHYKSESGLEAIDVIEAFTLDFLRGNAVKYILRAGKKDDAKQDMLKAKWYIERYIARLK